MNELLTSPFFYVILTLLCYLLSDYIYRKINLHYILPILVSMVLLITLLTVAGIKHSKYMAGGSVISFFLGPATVSLAVPLFRQMKLFNRKKVCYNYYRNNMSVLSLHFPLFLFFQRLQVFLILL